MDRASKRLYDISIFSCALAGALLSCSVCFSQNAAGQSRPDQAQPARQLAQSTGAGAATDSNALLEALIKEDEKKRAREQAAGKGGAANSAGQKLPAGTEAAAHGEITVL